MAELLAERDALHEQIKKLQEDIRLIQERFNPEYDV
jgi:cell division protein FtsB